MAPDGKHEEKRIDSLKCITELVNTHIIVKLYSYKNDKMSSSYART